MAPIAASDPNAMQVLLDLVAELRASLAAAEARAEAAERRVAELEVTVRELQARLGRDSSNSSRPPSSDGPGTKAAQRRQAGKRRSGRKAGGQKGHQGVTRELRPVEEADRVIDHRPERCGHCGGGLVGAKPAAAPIPHQQYELPPVEMLLLHHWVHRLVCPDCNQVTTAVLPPEAQTGQGPNLVSWIALLIGKYRLSRGLVASWLADLTGVRLSSGTVHGCWERMGEALAGPVDELEAALCTAETVHLDESGWREWGAKMG